MTSHETVTGLVSREVDTGDADRYLTLLTAEAGKVECYAKGIRKQTSKLAASAGMLTFGEFKLFASRDRRILISAQAIERFPGIGQDIMRYAYATHFLEIARDVMQEAQPFPEALQTLLNSLFVLAYKSTPPSFVARVFELRTLSLAGFAPVLDRCSVCGGSVELGGSATAGSATVGSATAGAATAGSATAGAATPKRYAFDVCGSGIVCGGGRCGASCAESMQQGAPYEPAPYGPTSSYARASYTPTSSYTPVSSMPQPVPVSPGAIRAMRHVATCGANDIFNFSVNEAVAGELDSIVPAYLRCQLGRDYPRLAQAERYSAFEEEARYIAASCIASRSSNGGS